MPKIVISTSSFDIENNSAINSLKSKGFEIIVNPYGRRLTESEISSLLTDDVVGMIAGVEPLTRKALQASPGLKVLSRCGVGMDNVDLCACGESETWVCNTPNAPAMAVAELTVALMLDLLRKVSQADRNIRAKKWKPLMGNLLSCQTVGIIGYGRIGKRVCDILKGFGVRLLVHDKVRIACDQGFSTVSFEELLSTSDIISLHVPYESANHHLIDHDSIQNMKTGAFLINASRGGLIDESELYVALKSGKLAGAALDTFEQEPYAGPLSELPNVILTPHMGSYAKECRIQMELESAENLMKGLAVKGII